MLLSKMTDYTETCTNYARPPTPETFNFCDVIDGYANDPTRKALIWLNEEGDERALTFHDISEGSKRIASVLRDRGVGRGDRVIVMLPRVPEWQMIMLAVFRIGAIAVPCITMLQPSDIAYRIGETSPKAIVTVSSELGKFDDLDTQGVACLAMGHRSAPIGAGWGDLLALAEKATTDIVTEQMLQSEGSILFFTSGSTGLPKGVLHSSYFALGFYEVSAYWLDLNEASQNDVMWGTADTGWSFAATTTLIGPWLAGVCALTYDGQFNAQRRLEIMERYGVTVYAAAASEFRWLLAEDIERFDLSQLRLTVTAGEALDAPTAAGWMDRAGCRIHEAYGQTEALMNVANFPVTEIRPGAMGLPIPGMPIDVIDEASFDVVRPGQIGHVALKMPFEGMMLGYWRAPQKTRDCYVTNEKGDQWYITGDLARRDDDGYFWYEGRSDDVISASGYRIGPAEVESALMGFLAIKEVAVVGKPDAERGEIVKAFVVLHDGCAETPEQIKDIQQYAKSQTAPYKYPRAVEFIDVLPKTVTGKVRRKDLRDLERQRAAVLNTGKTDDN